MLSFSRNTAFAVTWTTDMCHAVKICATGTDCRIDACWHGTLGKEGASLAELVLNGVKALGADDNAYIVAGGNGQGWGMADLNMPALKRDELRAALSFELRKQTPLPQDRLRWGYRLLPRKPGETTRPVRLFYVRNDYWNSWLKAADGLRHLDALLPAPVALDPVLEGASFILPGNRGTTACYEYAAGEKGRVIIPQKESEPLSIGRALPPGVCALGPVASCEAQEQLEFVPAILLALYGLTGCVNQDQNTMPSLPERFHARRNIPVKIAAICLAAYLIGLLVFWMAGNLSGHAGQLRQLEQALRLNRAELERLQVLLNPKDTERTALIQQELKDNIPDYPDFPTALLAVTEAVPATHWISDAFEWRDGQKISFKIQGPNKDLELTTRLEESPYLGDVMERLSTMNNGSFTQKFEATARYDTEIEKNILKTRQETIREREEERKAKAEELLKAAREEETESQEEDAPETEDVGEIPAAEEE